MNAYDPRIVLAFRAAADATVERVMVNAYRGTWSERTYSCEDADILATAVTCEVAL